MNKLTTLFFTISAFLIIFLLGVKTGEFKSGSQKPQLKSYKFANTKEKADETIDFSLFWQTWEKLEKKYVDKEKIDKKKMFYGAIKGMVASMDDQHTFFLTPDENNQYKQDLDGVFSGIGAQLGLKDKRIIVIAPLKASPAEKAGLRAGDEITKVDGKSTKNWSLIETITKIRGPKGEDVELTILREGKEFDVEIIRDDIKVSPVELSYEKNIAILKLNKFGDDTIAEWDKAISEIREKWDTKQIEGMILDLRDNPGGYLQGAVYVASEFIPLGSLVVKQESASTIAEEFKATRHPKLINIPLVILINKGSASASEIVAGALRDYDKTTLVGQSTFGKGSIQEAVELKEGAGVHITIAKWILPKGSSIDGTGIKPDIEVENKLKEGNTLTRVDDKQLDKALSELID